MMCMRDGGALSVIGWWVRSMPVCRVLRACCELGLRTGTSTIYAPNHKRIHGKYLLIIGN